MAATEFNDAAHWGFFMTGTTLTSSTGKYTRVSELTLAALRAQGVFDNMVDGTTPPATTSLWLDKNTDPAVLKEYDATGAAWVPMTFERLFGRAIVTPMAIPTGTADALVVAQPEPFIPHRIYSLTPVADNTGAATIQVTGVGTFAVTYTDGTALEAQEFKTGNPTILLFTGVRFEVIFKVADVYQAADAAAEAAEAALAAANAGFVFDTEADFEAANIPTPLQFVKTAGYYAPGDGGGHLKQRIATPGVVRPWHKQSADGAWWQISEGQDIHVEMFGARRYTAAQQTALGRAGVEASHQEFQDALDFKYETGGGVAFALGQFYTWDAGVRPKRNTGFVSAGHGAFPPSFPTEPKTWEGTNILLRGPSFPKETLEFGVTSMKKAGGWIADPDNGSRIFKLSSLSDDDASGTTPATTKQYAIGLMNADHDAPYMCRGFRLCPWIGNDGYSDYSLTTGNDFGDEIDICMVINDAEHGSFEDIQIRGYARAFGLLLLSAGYSREARCEGNILRKVSAQGFVGIGVRAGDIYTVIATTASTVEIPWTEESYWPSVGTFEGLQNGTDYTYTSLTRNGSNLVFNGVSPNPTGTTQIRNPLRGTGWSTMLMDSCEGWALYHHSGQTAETLGLGISGGFEISGFPMRGIHFMNCSFFGEATNAICAFLHDCDDIVFLGGKFEIGHLIASPLDNAAATTRNPLATNPQGSTSNLRFDPYTSTSTDKRLFTPRSVFYPQGQYNPATRQSANLLIEAMTGQEWQARIASGKNFQVLKSDGTTALNVTDSGNATLNGQLTVGASGSGGFVNSQSGQNLTLRENVTTHLAIQATTGHWWPGADNTQNVGSGALRMGTIFAGTGAINTSDARQKREIEAIQEAVLDAWGDVEWCQYRFKDGVRLHMGLVAQRVQSAFERHGLDAFGLGLLCYDEWDDIFEDVHEPREVLLPVLDADGVETGEYQVGTEIVATGEKRIATPAGNRYGLRYEECLAVEAAYQRRRLDRIEARLLGLA